MIIIKWLAEFKPRLLDNTFISQENPVTNHRISSNVPNISLVDRLLLPLLLTHVDCIDSSNHRSVKSLVISSGRHLRCFIKNFLSGEHLSQDISVKINKMLIEYVNWLIELDIWGIHFPAPKQAKQVLCVLFGSRADQTGYKQVQVPSLHRKTVRANMLITLNLIQGVVFGSCSLRSMFTTHSWSHHFIHCLHVFFQIN